LKNKTKNKNVDIIRIWVWYDVVVIVKIFTLQCTSLNETHFPTTFLSFLFIVSQAKNSQMPLNYKKWNGCEVKLDNYHNEVRLTHSHSLSTNYTWTWEILCVWRSTISLYLIFLLKLFFVAVVLSKLQMLVWEITRLNQFFTLKTNICFVRINLKK